MSQDIDLNYRPSSYFWAQDRNIALLSDIKGAERRKIYKAALQSGQADLVDDRLLQHDLTSAQRLAQGRIHPAFMGGEYLPSRQDGEVEIARITIESTTQDVTCVYVRQEDDKLHYRVVDEYEGMTLEGDFELSSNEPLTLVQLTDFFIKAWDLIGCLAANFEGDGYPRASVHGFVADASSSFYADFGRLVHARIDDWLDEVKSGQEEEPDDE